MNLAGRELQDAQDELNHIKEQMGEVGVKDQGLQVSLKKNQEQARGMTEKIGVMTNALHEARNGDRIL